MNISWLNKGVEIRHDSVRERIANIVLWVGYALSLYAFLAGSIYEFSRITENGQYHVAYWGYWFGMLAQGLIWLLVAWLPCRAIFYVMTGR